MTIEENIEAALFGHVRTLELTPAVPVAWPNNDFPGKDAGGAPLPKPATYLRVDHLPNDNERLFLKGSDPHRYIGILQITVVSPLNAGPQTATRLAGDVALHFPADRALYSEGLKVTIRKRPACAPAFKDDVSWNVPISIRYGTSA